MKYTWISILLLAIMIIPSSTFAQVSKYETSQTTLKTDTQNIILEKVTKAIREGNYKAEKLPITLQSRFVKDLGFDSLDIVEFIMEMEKQFGIAIPDATAEKIVTVQDAVRVIEALLKKKD